MRFGYKRPKITDVRSELETVFDVMMSDWFIVMDLFWCSVIFTLFLFPELHTIRMSIIFFIGSYVFFSCIFFFFFKKPKKNPLISRVINICVEFPLQREFPFFLSPKTSNTRLPDKLSMKRDPPVPTAFKKIPI